MAEPVGESDQSCGEGSAAVASLHPGLESPFPVLELVALAVVRDSGAEGLFLVAAVGCQAQVGKAVRGCGCHRDHDVGFGAWGLFAPAAVAAAVGPVPHGFRQHGAQGFACDDEERQFIVKAAFVGAAVAEGLQAHPKSADGAGELVARGVQAHRGG